LDVVVRYENLHLCCDFFRLPVYLWAMAYMVTRTVRGRQVQYYQESYRVGGKVKTRYLGTLRRVTPTFGEIISNIFGPPSREELNEDGERYARDAERFNQARMAAAARKAAAEPQKQPGPALSAAATSAPASSSVAPSDVEQAPSDAPSLSATSESL